MIFFETQFFFSPFGYSKGIMLYFKSCLPLQLIQVLFSYCSHSSSSSNSSSKSEQPEVTPNTLINTFPRAPGTSDSIRLKCREMISNALQTGGDALFVFIYLTFLQVVCLVRVFVNIFPHPLTFVLFVFQRIILPLVLIVTNLEHRSRNISFTLKGKCV